MANDKPNGTVIKKYANRRLYHTGTSAYVTLDDLADMVRRGEDFVVQDAKTGEDITRGVLAQIIFDAESRGGGLLPLAFLRQLITFYGGQMQGLVPSYLEHSLASFAKEQDKLRKQVGETGREALAAVEDQVRRNMDYFQRSVRMFMPFTPDSAPHPQAHAEDPLAQDVAALRAELARMQARLDALAAPQPAPPAAAARAPATGAAARAAATGAAARAAATEAAARAATTEAVALEGTEAVALEATEAVGREAPEANASSSMEDDEAFFAGPVKRDV